MNSLQIRYSDDGKRNWSNWRTFELGEEGDFLVEATALQMGQTKLRIYQVRDTSPYRNDIIAISVKLRGAG